MKNLRIKYVGHDENMEREIDRVLNKYGWETHSTGYDMRTQERDLWYERKK